MNYYVKYGSNENFLYIYKFFYLMVKTKQEKKLTQIPIYDIL